jgi:Phage integrase family
MDFPRFHDLRHTWASWHVMSGTSQQESMELGGWKSYEMVLRYAHRAPEHLADAASRTGKPLIAVDNCPTISLRWKNKKLTRSCKPLFEWRARRDCAARPCAAPCGRPLRGVQNRSRRFCRTHDRLVRSFNYALYLYVFINLLAVPPVAFCSTKHNRAGLGPARVRRVLGMPIPALLTQ